MKNYMAVVTPWYDPEQRDRFLHAWGLSVLPSSIPDWLILEQDRDRSGCAATKNRGIQTAKAKGYRAVVILDDDCYPTDECRTLEELMLRHEQALEDQGVQMFQPVTEPYSRGTPYTKAGREIVMPVAASMGFWSEIGDYCGVRQLEHDGAPMTFHRGPIFGRYFPLSGMNVAFKLEWLPWCNFIDVPRFDDIWMGWLFQKRAYASGYCFNLNGPTVRHARQSDPWRNLQVEARHLKANETLWTDIAEHPSLVYKELYKLLPLDPGGSDR
jgi:hypothetical protein